MFEDRENYKENIRPAAARARLEHGVSSTPKSYDGSIPTIDPLLEKHEFSLRIV